MQKTKQKQNKTKQKTKKTKKKTKKQTKKLFMCFKREGAISAISSRPLKLVDKFLYLSSNISSIESDVKIHLAKAMVCCRQVIDRMEFWSLR